MPKRSRSELRLRRYQKIIDTGLPALSCRRCILKSSDCICVVDGSCAECVLSGMEKKCDAKSSRTDRVLSEQKVALDKAIQESLEASAKVSRLQKVIRKLESKSRKEYDDIMKELENENSGENDSGEGPSQSSDNSASPSGGVSSSGNDRAGVSSMDMSWFDQAVNEAGLDSSYRIL